MERCCNCTDGGEPKYSETYPSATLSTIPATQTGLGLIPGLDGGRVTLQCVMGIIVSELLHHLLHCHMITRRRLFDASKHQELQP